MCVCAVVMMVAAISTDPNKSTPSDQNPRKSSSSSNSYSNNNSNSNSNIRPPLLPSEKDNGSINPNKRPKSKQVSSRYMSPSSSSSSSSTTNIKRSSSPLVSRNSSPSLNNSRSASVDRRRPLPSRPDLNPKIIKKGSEMSAAAKLLVTSTRSLSVSFQGEAYSFPVSKTKPQSPNLASVRKGTPERKRSSTPNIRTKDSDHHMENSKPIDQHRWPARSRQSPNTLSRSLNYSAEDKKRLVGSDKVIRALQQSMISDEGRRASFDGRLSISLGNTELLKAREKHQSFQSGDKGQRASFDGGLGLSLGNTRLLNSREKQQTSMGDEGQRAFFDGRSSLNLGSTELPKASEKKQSLIADEGRRASFDSRLDLNSGNAELMKARELGPTRCSVNESDSESVSSGSTSGVQDFGAVKPRGFSVSARFWQETNSRLRRLHDPGSPLSNSPSKLAVPPKFGQSKKYPSEGVMSSPRAMSSPVRSGVRPSSPSKFMPSMVSSPSRGMTSPSRVRNLISGISEIPSVLSYAVDVRRGKVGENQLVDAHLLRLLYNRHLQWRFVNARAESALLVQKRSAEKNLWNAWIKISGLRDSVTKKRHRLQLLRQRLKLSSILKGQITFLEGWAFLEKEHFVSLLGAIEALRASTLRLPVVGATADVQNVKEAIDSAVNMMQAMASSLSLLSTKADETNSLVVELAKVTAKESALLEKCKGFFSMLASMQVKNCSLRTHMLQHHRVPAA